MEDMEEELEAQARFDRREAEANRVDRIEGKLRAVADEARRELETGSAITGGTSLAKRILEIVGGAA